MEALSNFFAILEEARSLEAPYHIATKIVNSTKYIAYLQHAYDKEEAQTRIENVQELLSALSNLPERGITTLDAFLDEVALLQEHVSKSSDKQDHIRLMTLHGAKGLEFDTVILAGLEEGILPSSHAVCMPELVAEERRLLYVGLTRAANHILITSCTYRSTYGKTTEQLPSRFIYELQSDVIQHQDCSQWSQQMCEQYLALWMGNAIKKSITPQNSQNIVSASSPSISHGWKQYQAVTHDTFGVGIIEKIEKKSGQEARLTIRFKQGIKKISANFVQPS
jgi:DNA helicase-2/ATP-dependent DNA helicase PcrA